MPIEPITIILITLLCSSFVKLIVGYLYSRFPCLSIKVTKNNRTLVLLLFVEESREFGLIIGLFIVRYILIFLYIYEIYFFLKFL